MFEQGLPETTHATRDTVAKTPYFSRDISCLAPIMDESGCSRRILGMGRSGIIRVYSVEYPLFYIRPFRS